MNRILTFILFFTFVFGALEIESLNPNEGEAGSTLSVELTANGVDFYDGYTTLNSINFNPAGVNVDSFAISSTSPFVWTTPVGLFGLLNINNFGRSGKFVSVSSNLDTSIL